jgi:hypothetical protein
MNRLLKLSIPEHMYQELRWWGEVLGLDDELTARLVLTAGFKAIRPLTDQPKEEPC